MGDNEINRAGRLHNLTALEQVRLKEMWAYVLVNHGYAPESLVEDIAERADAMANGSRRGGMFAGKLTKTNSNTSDNVQYTRQDFADAMADIPFAEQEHAFISAFKSRHPDQLLLRFLRMKKWVVPEALKMMGENLSWRVNFGVEDILYRGDLGAIEDNELDMIAQYRSKKSYVRGEDRKGQPLNFISPQYHRPQGQSQEVLERFTIAMFEQSFLCAKDPEVDSGVIVFDMTNFGLANMDYFFIKLLIRCHESLYPETIDKILVHKAPWVFQGIWSVIKNWLNPVIRGRIVFTRNAKDLLKFIDEENLPKENGGSRKFDYEFIEPDQYENELQEDISAREILSEEYQQLYRTFVRETIEWIRTDDPKETQAIQARKDEIARELGRQYWRLDPYIRGCTVSDRNGSIVNPLMEQ